MNPLYSGPGGVHRTTDWKTPSATPNLSPVLSSRAGSRGCSWTWGEAAGSPGPGTAAWPPLPPAPPPGGESEGWTSLFRLPAGLVSCSVMLRYAALPSVSDTAGAVQLALTPAYQDGAGAGLGAAPGPGGEPRPRPTSTRPRTHPVRCPAATPSLPNTGECGQRYLISPTTSEP